jgi:hypothetical protein
MRGVAYFIGVIFVLGIVVLVGTATVEPVGEFAKDRDSIDSINGSDKIDTTYDVVFKWMPLMVMGGFGVWAGAWYLRRERRPGGGGRLR